jgi:hypothetical protein
MCCLTHENFFISTGDSGRDDGHRSDGHSDAGRSSHGRSDDRGRRDYSRSRHDSSGESRVIVIRWTCSFHSWFFPLLYRKGGDFLYVNVRTDTLLQNIRRLENQYKASRLCLSHRLFDPRRLGLWAPETIDYRCADGRFLSNHLGVVIEANL